MLQCAVQILCNQHDREVGTGYVLMIARAPMLYANRIMTANTTSSGLVNIR